MYIYLFIFLIWVPVHAITGTSTILVLEVTLLETVILITFKIRPCTLNLVSISFQSKLATVQVNYSKEKTEEVDLLIVTPKLFPFEDYKQRFGSVTFLLRIRILGSVHWIRNCFVFLLTTYCRYMYISL